MSTSDYKFSLSLKRQERSKDSNWRITKITVASGKVSVTKNYGGFKSQKNKQSEKKINPATEKEIFDFIVSNKLNINLKEHRKTGIGISAFLDIELTTNKTTNINISGMSKIWGTDSYVKKQWKKKYIKSRTNIKNIEYIELAENFIKFISNLES